MLMMKCDCEGCNSVREFQFSDVPWEGDWITVSGKVHLYFCSLSCAITYARKQTGHE